MVVKGVEMMDRRERGVKGLMERIYRMTAAWQMSA